MRTYLEAKEYVDTAIIPLLPMDWKSDPMEKVAMSESILEIVDRIEKQFIGRVFQMPPFIYIKNEGADHVGRLIEWDKHFKENGFQHIVYITSDSDWKLVENELP